MFHLRTNHNPLCIMHFRLTVILALQSRALTKVVHENLLGRVYAEEPWISLALASQRILRFLPDH